MTVEVNSKGVNKKIMAHILSEEEMRKIGFTDFNKNYWYFCKLIKFPKNKKYKDFEISFEVTIPKDGSDIEINALDENFLQPYDYQYMLNKSPNFEPCLIVKRQVEEWMKYLQDKGILSGHKYDEYI